MEKEEEVERRRNGKTILKTGYGWTLSAPQGQLKTEQSGKGVDAKSSVVPQIPSKVMG